MEVVDRDIVVIGAGPCGLAFAKLYLDLHPKCNLEILESSSVLGGVWSSERTYDGFWSQTNSRMAGFSDLPFEILPELIPHDHDLFEAKWMTHYLETYARRSFHNGKSLKDCINFGSTVKKVWKLDKNQWMIDIDRASGALARCRARKLVVATGRTSIPNLPVLPCTDHFEGRVVHQKDFGQSGVLTSPEKIITVLGAGKSAADMVYACVKAGKTVNWLIREDGTGPGILTSPKAEEPLKNSGEHLSIRFVAAMSPSCFAPRTWLTRILHQTALGRKVVEKFWRNAQKSSVSAASYHNHRPPSLKPENSIYWLEGPIGMVQMEDFWLTINHNVCVHRSNIQEIQGKKLVLGNGESLPTDVLLCGTGWQESFPFFTTEQLGHLGLPQPFSDQEPTVEKEWAALDAGAERKVLSQFPSLAIRPAHRQPLVATTPYRLHNLIASPADSSIAFLGNIVLSNNFRGAEIQAMWTAAYLDGRIALPSENRMQKGIAFNNAFCRRRYPVYGSLGNFFYHDMTGYTDKLLAELGLRAHLKWWWPWFTEPCLTVDFARSRLEFCDKYRESANDSRGEKKS